MIEIPDPDQRLSETNEKCEHFYEILKCILIKWTSGFMMVMSAASILICQLKYGFGHLVSAELFHPARLVYVLNVKFCYDKLPKYFMTFYCSLPWNQECFFGYIGEIFAVILMFDIFFIIAGQMSLLYISICIHFFTFNKMFASFVNDLDNSPKEEEKIEVIQKLIEFHVDIKRCVKNNSLRFYWFQK